MNIYPALVIGQIGKHEDKLRENGISVVKVTCLDDLRQFVFEHIGLRLKTPIAVSDLSKVKDHTSHILKFVEEFQSPLIVLAAYDNIPQVLLSRFKSVRKFPYKAENKCDDLLELKQRFGEEIEDRERYNEILLRCPSFLPFYSTLKKSRLSSQDKILRAYLSC